VYSETLTQELERIKINIGTIAHSFIQQTFIGQTLLNVNADNIV